MSNPVWIGGILNIQESLDRLPKLVRQCEEYSGLWMKRPEDFFADFWKDLQSLLQCNELTIIFSTVMEEEEKEEKKPQLVRVVLTGEEDPELRAASAAEDKLYMDLSQLSQDNLVVQSLDQDKRVVSLVGRLGKIPFIIMAKDVEYNAFVDSLLRSYMNGIEHFLMNKRV